MEFAWCAGCQKWFVGPQCVNSGCLRKTRLHPTVRRKITEGLVVVGEALDQTSAHQDHEAESDETVDVVEEMETNQAERESMPEGLSPFYAEEGVARDYAGGNSNVDPDDSTVWETDDWHESYKRVERARCRVVGCKQPYDLGKEIDGALDQFSDDVKKEIKRCWTPSLTFLAKARQIEQRLVDAGRPPFAWCPYCNEAGRVPVRTYDQYLSMQLPKTETWVYVYVPPPKVKSRRKHD